MQCKKCNAFIPEGYLYCPKCGEEIIIVSDFEIKLEDNIDTSLIAKTTELPDVDSKINENILKSDTVEIPDIDKPAGANAGKDRDILELEDNNKIPTHAWILAAVIGTLVACGIIFAIISYNRYMSYDYQYNKAYDEAADKDYSAAIKTLRHAVTLEDDEKGKLLLADCYIATSNYDAAIAVLYEISDDDPGNLDIYDRIVDCYEKQGDSRGIHELIENSDDSNLALRYSDYVSITPTFSLESGTYIEPDPIKLSAPEGGIIYYTTDGSTPTEDSLVYTAPIPLDVGDTTISAIYVNDKGIVSDVVTATYSVEVNVPDAPTLLVESGSLSVPKLIGVKIPEGTTVYYTTDGSTPNYDCRQYSKSFLMPLGKSTYSFIAYDEDNVPSEVVTGNYNLTLQGIYDIENAQNTVMYSLTARGEFVMGFTYKANYGYSKDEGVYYIIEEYEGNNKTGRAFAVESSSGTVYSFDKNSYSLNPF